MGTKKNRLGETVLFSIHSIYCYFANNMDPDQTVSSGFIVFASMIKFCLKYTAYVKKQATFLG